MKKRKTSKIIIAISFLVFAIFISEGLAVTNISSTDRWAWSDLAGWWDFYGTNTIEVGADSLSGYASSDIGEMALNCASTPSGDVCSSSNFKVTNIDNSGDLSGCAWNDNIGWISFWCGDSNCSGAGTEDGGSFCSTSNYRVTIDDNGTFNGYAWNDIEGWISFNCSNDGSCGGSDFKTRTSWAAEGKVGTLESSIIDTQVEDGATLQSITWQGSQPAGTSVDFQIAVSNNDSGPWSYLGPDESSESYYGQECPLVGESNPGAGPGKSICINKNITEDNRYLRYKVRLQTNETRTETPVINDIILNWAQ